MTRSFHPAAAFVVVALGILLCFSPFAGCGIDGQTSLVECLGHCDRSIPEESDDVAHTFVLRYFIHFSAHVVAFACLARCVAWRSKRVQRTASLYRWALAYFVSSAASNGVFLFISSMQRCLPQEVGLSSESHALFAGLFILLPSVRNILLQRVLLEKIRTIEEPCLLPGQVSRGCCCSLSSSSLGKLLRAQLFLVLPAAAIIVVRDVLPSWFVFPALAFDALAFWFAQTCFNYFACLRHYDFIKNARAALEEDGALRPAVETARRNFFATLMAVLTAFIWEAVLLCVFFGVLGSTALVWNVQISFATLDSGSNDVCMAALLGTGLLADSAERAFHKITTSAESATSRKVGASQLLAAHVAGSLQVRADTGGHIVLSADAGAQKLLGEVCVVGAPLAVALPAEEAGRVESFLASIPAEAAQALVMRTTVQSREVQLYASVVSAPERTIAVWFILPTNEIATRGFAAEPRANEGGKMRFFCLPSAAREREESVPWTLVASCVDGYLRLASLDDGSGHEVISADAGAALLFAKASAVELEGLVFESLAAADDRDALWALLADAPERGSLVVGLCGKDVHVFVSALAQRPRRILSVWLTEVASKSAGLAAESSLEDGFDDIVSCKDVVLSVPTLVAEVSSPSERPASMVTARIALEEFFSGLDDGQIMVDGEAVCVVVHCGARMEWLGVQQGDVVAQVNDTAVRSADHFQQLMCDLFAEAQKARHSMGAVALTLSRCDGTPQEQQSDGSVHSGSASEARTWRSMSTTAARYPNPMQLPGLDLTRAKQREFHGQMLALHDAQSSLAAGIPRQVLETLDEEPSNPIESLDDGQRDISTRSRATPENFTDTFICV